MVHPIKEAVSKLLENSGFGGSGSVLSITEASFRLAICSALTDFVSWVDAR